MKRIDKITVCKNGYIVKFLDGTNKKYIHRKNVMIGLKKTHRQIRGLYWTEPYAAGIGKTENYIIWTENQG